MIREVTKMEIIQKPGSVPQAATQNPLLLPKETADFLRTTVGVLSVWRCTKRHPLKYVKVGRSVRYRLEDVLAFIESRTVEV